MAPITYNMDPSKGGIKHDGEKLRWDLFPLETLHGVLRVLMHGEKKYTAFNWANGMPYTRVLNAALRHIVALSQGEDIDPDSGLDHVDHAICELMFLKYYKLYGVGEDDRFKRLTPGQQAAVDVWPTLTPVEQVRLRDNTTSTVFNQYNAQMGEWSFGHEDAEGDRNYWGV